MSVREEATGDEAIKCPCACMIEKGKMVCCDVFGG